MKATIVTHRADWRVYVVFSLTLGVFFVCFFVPWLQKPSFGWQPSAVVVAIYLAIVVWLRSFEIRISPDTISFRSLGGGTRSIPVKDISKTWLGVELSSRKGPLRLRVDARPESSSAPIEINAKVFSSEAIADVLRLGELVAESDPAGLEKGVVSYLLGRAARRISRSKG